MDPRDVGIEVVIPAYNAEEWLGQTVRSALAIPEITRVWVIDDGSTIPAADSIADLAAEFGDRLRVERKANEGGQRARNHGYLCVLGAGESRWIVNLDHDDVLEPGIVDAVVLGEKLGAAAVIPDREEFDDAGWREQKQRPADVPANEPIDPGLVHRPLAVFTATGLVLSRKAIEAGVRFDDRFVVADDRDVLRQAGSVGPIAICDSIGLSRRVFRDGRNLSSWRTLAGQAEDFRLLHERWYDPKDDAGWRDQGLWILNQIVKRGVRGTASNRMMDVFRERGWALPLKVRARLLTHRLRGFTREASES